MQPTTKPATFCPVASLSLSLCLPSRRALLRRRHHHEAAPLPIHVRVVVGDIGVRHLQIGKRHGRWRRLTPSSSLSPPPPHARARLEQGARVPGARVQLDEDAGRDAEGYDVGGGREALESGR